MEVTETIKITDSNLKKAIGIRFGRHFPAMNLMNALGGTQTTEWKIIRQFNALQMVKEAIERGIDVESIVPSLGDSCTCGECFPTVGETPLYKAVMDLIENDEEAAEEKG